MIGLAQSGQTRESATYDELSAARGDSLWAGRGFIILIRTDEAFWYSSTQGGHIVPTGFGFSLFLPLCAAE
jgi:hypothetical protein